MKLLKRIIITLLCICLVYSGITTDVIAANETIIDCTDLFVGDVISHDCTKYLGTKYNGTYHWNECTICNKKFNITSHRFSQYWTMGNSCHPNNKLRHICSCGYSYDTNNTRGHAGIVMNMDSGIHQYSCTGCGVALSNQEAHYNSRRQLIGCRTGITGTCAVCGRYCGLYDHNQYGGYSFIDNTQTMSGCSGCGAAAFTGINGSISYSGNTFYMTFYIPYNPAYGNLTNISFAEYPPTFTMGNTGVITGYNCYQSGNAIVYAVSGYSINIDSTTNYFQTSFRAVTSSGHVFYLTFGVYFKPELNPPAINNISSKDLEANENWVTAKQITIQGTENYCGTIYLSMTDSKGNIYLNRESVRVSNGNWTYTFIPEIEADEQGSNFTITAMDSLGNVSSKSVIYYNTDKKTPTMVSSKETSKEWTRTKDFVIDATDFGARNVSIAFNEEEDYRLAERENDNFTRPYVLTGDVYGQTVAAIYIKDGLGNTRTEFVKIYNLDNTAPTITNAVSKRQGTRNAVVTVTANDINTKLNASGSGVAGYTITKDTTKPNEEGFQPSNVFNLTKSGTWYVWAIDKVGNISEPVPVNVEIEYTVSLDANGGELTDDTEYKVISGETITIPEPEREGYTFIGWTVDGEESFINGNDFTMGSEDTTITANWEINQYQVDYIDVIDSITGEELGRTSEMIDFNTLVRGEDIGGSAADNAYYNGYYYTEDTSARVTTNGATVYRIFKRRTIEVSGTVFWKDNSNKHGTRPDSTTITIYRDGKIINTWTGLTKENSNTYIFPDLPKYSTTDGHIYDYTISQSDVISKYSPEDKYITSQSGYDIVNALTNVEADDPEEGLSVNGIIYWEDKGDRLGFRPSTVKISLYQNSIFYKDIKIDATQNIYEFPKLPKYDENLEKYEYTVEETIESIYVLPDGTIVNVYDIIPDMPNDLDFTNIFHVTDLPVHPAKPEHINEITVKTNTNDKVAISLKGMEYIINPDLTVTHGHDYNGCVYNIFANSEGITFEDIPCGKYEIFINDIEYDLNSIITEEGEYISVVYEDGRYYLIIQDSSESAYGVINIDLFKKERGYITSNNRNNYFKVHMQMGEAIRYTVAKASNIVVTAPDVYTVTYMESDTTDNNVYESDEEITVLDYLGTIPENKEFSGWKMENSETIYSYGDTIIANTDVILYPVFEEINTEEVLIIDEENKDIEETEVVEEEEKTDEEELNSEVH